MHWMNFILRLNLHKQSSWVVKHLQSEQELLQQWLIPLCLFFKLTLRLRLRDWHREWFSHHALSSSVLWCLSPLSLCVFVFTVTLCPPEVQPHVLKSLGLKTGNIQFMQNTWNINAEEMRTWSRWARRKVSIPLPTSDSLRWFPWCLSVLFLH